MTHAVLALAHIARDLAVHRAEAAPVFAVFLALILLLPIVPARP